MERHIPPSQTQGAMERLGQGQAPLQTVGKLGRMGKGAVQQPKQRPWGEGYPWGGGGSRGGEARDVRSGTEQRGTVGRQLSAVMLPSVWAELPLLWDIYVSPLSSPSSEVGSIGLSLAQGPHPAELDTLQGDHSVLLGSLSWGALLKAVSPQGPHRLGKEPQAEPPVQWIRHRDDAWEPAQDPWGRAGDMGHGS